VSKCFELICSLLSLLAGMAVGYPRDEYVSVARCICTTWCGEEAYWIVDELLNDSFLI